MQEINCHKNHGNRFFWHSTDVRGELSWLRGNKFKSKSHKK